MAIIKKQGERNKLTWFTEFTEMNWTELANAATGHYYSLVISNWSYLVQDSKPRFEQYSRLIAEYKIGLLAQSQLTFFKKILVLSSHTVLTFACPTIHTIHLSSLSFALFSSADFQLNVSGFRLSWVLKIMPVSGTSTWNLRSSTCTTSSSYILSSPL